MIPRSRPTLEQQMIDGLHPWKRGFSFKLLLQKQNVVTLRNEHYNIVRKTNKLKRNRVLEDLGVAVKDKGNMLKQTLLDHLGMTTMDELIVSRYLNTDFRRGRKMLFVCFFVCF